MKLLALIVTVAVAVAAWVVLARQKQPGSEATTTISDVEAAQRKFLLVVLRRGPADLRPESLEAAARSAWTGDFGSNEDGSDFVEQTVPNEMAILQAHGNAFTVIGGEKDRRTLEPPETFLPDGAAPLWTEYSHDLSIGVAYNYDTDPRRLAAFVGKLTAALCDDESIALYHPETRRLWELNEATRARLATGSEEFFDTAATQAP